MILLGMIAATAFPQIATVSPLYLLMRALGLRDTWLALILANASFALPLVIWLLAGFIREIPRALEEAASVDGAGRLASLRFVVLPLVAPGMASAALLAFLFSWNEFLFAYSFTATEASRTVPVALALFPGVFEVPWGDIAAASLLASLPPILIVADVWRTTPFVALLCYARLLTIPGELYEAAEVDGAAGVQAFARITWPLVRPILLVALLFRTLDALRAFDLMFVLTGGGPAGTTETLTVYAYRALFQTLQVGFGSAIGVVVFALVMVVAVAYLRMIHRQEASV